MNYRKIPFSNFSLMSQVVHDVYELKSSQAEETYSTAPNGIIGISIVVEGEHSLLADGKWQLSPPISVYGLVNKPDVIKISRRFREIAIGFKPYYLQLLLKNSMADISGGGNKNAFDFFNTHDLEELFEQLLKAEHDREKLTAIEGFLLKQVQAKKENRRLENAVNLLYRHRVNSVSQLSEALNLSSVSIRNLFSEGVGRSPKEVIKILRIHKALQTSQHQINNLTQLGYDLGYFDQSHFIRDFKAFFGFSPRHYFTNSNLPFDFYNFGRWKGNIFDQNTSS